MNKDEREQLRFQRFAEGVVAADADVVQLLDRFYQRYVFAPPDGIDEALAGHNESFIRFAAETGIQVERGPCGWRIVRPAGGA